MARYFDVHPVDPQRRAIGQIVDLIRDSGLVAYPTDSCYALGCQLGDREGIDRMRTIRKLDDRHHFTLVCRDFAQLGQFVHVSNAVFRAVKAATPGSYTFILPATKEVPRRLLHPRKKTVGVRIPRHVVTQAILAELGEPLLSSTLLLPDQDEPLTQGWEIKEELDHVVDAVVDSGDCGTEPTTVVDLSGDAPRLVREGKGDIRPFGFVKEALHSKEGQVANEDGQSSLADKAGASLLRVEGPAAKKSSVSECVPHPRQGNLPPGAPGSGTRPQVHTRGLLTSE